MMIYFGDKDKDSDQRGIFSINSDGTTSLSDSDGLVIVKSENYNPLKWIEELEKENKELKKKFNFANSVLVKLNSNVYTMRVGALSKLDRRGCLDRVNQMVNRYFRKIKEVGL